MRFDIPKRSSMFPETINIENCTFDFNGWSDSVGRYIVKEVKDIPTSLNNKLESVAKRIADMKDINIDEIQYDSKKFDIEWLRVRE